MKGEFDGVLGDVDPISDRTFGVLFELNQLADRLGITKALGRNTMAKLALFLVLARVAHKGSRLSAVRWAKNHCVAEILGLYDFNKKDLYQALDWIARHQDKIEKKLFRFYLPQSENLSLRYHAASNMLMIRCRASSAL